MAFLKKNGCPPYDWGLVQSISAVLFSSSSGLSEAKMYHCVMDIKQVSSGEGSLTSPKGGKSSGVLNSPRMPGSGPAEPPPRRTMSGKLIRLLPKRLAMSLGDFDEAAAALAPPPSVCVLKHYDTSKVETQSLVMRAARHLTGLTAEQMAKHELFFYTKVQPMLERDRAIVAADRERIQRILSEGGEVPPGTDASFSPSLFRFNSAKLLFVSHKDKGDPGLLRYVCCRSGSGSVTTFGLEDLSHQGFSFHHTGDDGLYDAPSIRACLAAMAAFHSSNWSRFVKRFHTPSASGHSGITTGTSSSAGPSSLPRSGTSPVPAQVQQQQSGSSGSGSGGSGGSAGSDRPVVGGPLGASPPSITNDSIFIPSLEVTHPTTVKLMDPPPASIARFVHRCGRKVVEKMSHNNDLPSCVSSLTELFRKWGQYWPILQCEDLQRSLRKVYTNWSSIRARATKIVLTNQTILHGDFHHRNIGLRRLPNSPLASASRGNKHWGHSYASRSERFEEEARSRAEADTLEVAAIDYQGCGTGHVAHELLYFICCSLPVEIYWEAQHQQQQQQNNKQPPSLVPPAENKRGSTGSSNSSGKKGGKKAAQDPQQRAAASAKKEYQFTLPELRELDNAIYREYYANLSPSVQANYALPALVEDIHVLVQHWAGCLLMDMAQSSVDERIKLKASSASMKSLLDWAEKTATRVMWMAASILTPGRSNSSGGTVDSMLSSAGASSSFDASTASRPRAASSAES